MIARVRKRSRVRSVSFRTLFWLIHREAAWSVLSWHSSWFAYTQSRRDICYADREWLNRRVAETLRQWPTRGVQS